MKSYPKAALFKRLRDISRALLAESVNALLPRPNHLLTQMRNFGPRRDKSTQLLWWGIPDPRRTRTSGSSNDREGWWRG